MPFISFDRVRYCPNGNCSTDRFDIDIVGKPDFF